MKNLFTTLLFLHLSLCSFSQLAFNIGAPYQDIATGISRDTPGNIYVTGTFQGSLDLDPGPGMSLLLAAGDPSFPDSQDVFIARYTPEGDFSWGFSISSPGKDMSYSIEAKGGFIYVCGYIQGEAEFDPGVTSAILNSGEGQDAFVAVYDTLGTFVWAQVLGDEEGVPFASDDFRYEVAYDLSVDEAGNTYLAGAFTGAIDFEPNNSSPFDSFFSVADGNGIPGRDIFVVSYNPAGNYRWGFGIGGMEEEQAQAIEFYNGSLFVGGKFMGTTDLNPSGQQANYTSHGGTDAFLARYQASDGTFDWAATWGGSGAEEVSQGAIALNLSGKVFAGGNFDGMSNFDPLGGGQAIPSQGGKDMFVSQFGIDGSYDWTKTRGTAEDDFLTDVGVDDAGFIYSAGTSEGKLFLERRDEFGNSSWTRQLGMDGISNSRQQVADLAISEEGDVYFAGTFFQSIDVDPSTDIIELSSMGDSDACVIRYSPEGLLSVFGTAIEPEFSQLVSDLKIYPNPASEQLSITFELLEASELHIALRNSLGQIVQIEKLENRIGNISYKLPLSSLPSGGYLLEIRTKSGIYFERIWVE